MDDLVRWLGEQLDEDAATVAAVQPDPGLSPQEPIEFILAGQDITVPATEAAERHIRRFADPARVLREIAADRRLLAEFMAVGAREVSLDDAAEYAHGWVNALGLAVRLRATRYSDRPGYRSEWAPTP